MKFIFRLILPLLLAAGFLENLQAQNGANGADALWPIIETRLDHSPSDTSRHFILLVVRDHCGADFDCLYHNYYSIMIKLERRFNLPAAIFVGEEIVALAKRQQDLRREASVHMSLDRYYSAAGIHGKAVFHIEKAIDLYEQLNDQTALNKAKFVKLEESLTYLPLDQILPGFKELLANARQNKDTSGIKYMLIRLIDCTLSTGRYDEALTYIDALDQFSISDPIESSESYIALMVASGRAKLAYARNDLDEAGLYYKKALHLSREKPDPWQEVNMLKSLAGLEWKRENRDLAKSFLEEAQSKSEELQLHDHLSGIFQLKAQYAEEEGLYAEALNYTKQRYFHEKELKERNADFDMQNYYLQLEKDKLAAEKKSTELALESRKSQLRNSLIITILVVLLAAGLFIGLYKQRKTSKQLKSLDAAKSHFFANVSHELRTPLTLILGPVQTLLKGGQLNEKQAHLLEMADHSGQKLQELVNEILDLQKLEMGKMEANLQPMALAPFFRNQFVQFESLAERHRIDFSFETNMDDALAAHIDPAKCRQILNNLLSNAFKFTPPGGQIKAILSVNEGMLKLEVADSGPGIHPDDLRHVFDRFFQTSRPDKPAEGGTGIGLALCQEYARLFGGNIEVKSALGEGSVFRVWWPVSLAESAQFSVLSFQSSVFSEETPEAIQKKQDSSKATILVVEDNPELQDYIRLILSEKYNVITAGNGEEALNRKLNIENCQLILSDLMMPVMDGFQLLEALKSNDSTRHIPVVMLTARAEAKDKLHALRIGVDDYLLKPFDEEELLARIGNLLRNQAARLENLPEEAAPPALSATDREWLERFETFVQKNLSSDMLTIPMLADEFAMSESTLLRQLKRLTGLTPVQYLVEVRLDRARQLLENRTHDSIAKVAAEAGYSDARAFSRSFKQRFGKSPSEV